MCLGTNPICIRPYRYPHYQEIKNKKLVKELLSAGLIKPSISAFSSPAILGKKKFDIWRFCIDYKALNQATIPNQILMPTIDKLIDELQKENIFTKLDLRSRYHQAMYGWTWCI